ncbi:MAG: hypothetical protein ACTSV3_04460 [Candidatus Thorarchaeota archaeon]|nr:MAG: hypothetical protein DRP09_02605 [Candidatus Thorarchaeota archaeon]RLI60027.1 MAG: hypothetical protein DRO87_01055 [Candidatus Thorarchaeota archaeon]
MSNVPLHKNTVLLVTLAIVAALGIVVRFWIQITVIPNVVVLTPGFMFSLLGGILGGAPGGVLVGAVVGLSGALTGTEIPILPMIGNICLGLGSGYAIYISKRDTIKYYVLVILGGGIIGGFIPTMTIFSSLEDSLAVNLAVASIDMIQGFLWAAAALVVEKLIFRPLIGEYIYGSTDVEELPSEEA